MNRDIKFRALVQYSAKEPYWEYYDPLVIPYAFTDQGDGFCKVIVKNLEYTGLKDKNGNEIYEGDLLRWIDWQQEGTETPDIYEVYYEGHSFKDRWFNSSREGGESDALDKPQDFEVIGNIYENPELLKKYVAQ